LPESRRIGLKKKQKNTGATACHHHQVQHANVNNPEKIRASTSVRSRISVRCSSASLVRPNAYPTDNEVRGPTASSVFGAGAHVCNHLQSKSRPPIAVWLVETLK